MVDAERYITDIPYIASSIHFIVGLNNAKARWTVAVKLNDLHLATLCKGPVTLRS